MKIRDSNEIEWTPNLGNEETKQYEIEQKKCWEEYFSNNADTEIALAYKGNYRTCRRIRNRTTKTS